ncbi:conserved unknown protein [Ectocarpus siliculosus]|uniref:Uncharacterized protein n=1 Tax=Ectocarpus siliculosus TaxID=2880 RepID=D7FWX5_ECTSI|nr:conserved unknown protein [Ectocarpus siliculosus]|eukprot:CBJ32213.1 conserved unknown protein [Ectocarpus siliculosus]
MKATCLMFLGLAGRAAGAASDSVSAYHMSCHGVYNKIARQAMGDIKELQTRVDSGEACPALGEKADSICNQALEQFSTDAADTENDPTKESIFDEKVEELETSLDLPLQLVYMKQLTLLREKALQRYKTLAKGSETSDYQAMVAADQWFVKEAEASTRAGSSWEFSAVRNSLQTAMNEMAQRGKKATDAAVRAAQQTSTAMQYLQMQQQQLAALQNQLYGGQPSPWNFGAAYRIPDSNINLSGTYQQGKANLQMTCVPDEYSSMLGAQGFTHGVGPGNLGLSVNLSI